MDDVNVVAASRDKFPPAEKFVDVKDDGNEDNDGFQDVLTIDDIVVVAFWKINSLRFAAESIILFFQGASGVRRRTVIV